MNASLLEPPEPGTLLWIGPTTHAEFVDAYRFCRDHVAQIAVRRSVREAIERPAGYVRRVIVARPTRHTPPRPLLEMFAARYGRAPVVALVSSLCDGEGRTGTPWPAATTLRFSRWSEWLPEWLAPCGVSMRSAEGGAALLVISDRFEMAEPYLLWASERGLLSHWHRRFVPALHHGFDTVLWDDSSARPAAAPVWRQRLGEQSGGDRHGQSAAAQRRHIWLALQPSIDAVQQALAGGITRVLTKPLNSDAIFQSLQSA